MNLLGKVGNIILTRGDIVKAPSGSSDWVVVKHEDGKIMMACVSKYMTKDEKEVKEWFRVT